MGAPASSLIQCARAPSEVPLDTLPFHSSLLMATATSFATPAVVCESRFIYWWVPIHLLMSPTASHWFFSVDFMVYGTGPDPNPWFRCIILFIYSCVETRWGIGVFFGCATSRDTSVLRSGTGLSFPFSIRILELTW